MNKLKDTRAIMTAEGNVKNLQKEAEEEEHHIPCASFLNGENANQYFFNLLSIIIYLVFF